MLHVFIPVALKGKWKFSDAPAFVIYIKPKHLQKIFYFLNIIQKMHLIVICL
jgi:hypothetical protein